MKNLPMTVTLPEGIIRDLHLYIPPRQISKFIAEVLKKSLEDKKKLLSQEFEEAAKDSMRNAEIREWDTLAGDGLDETNQY